MIRGNQFSNSSEKKDETSIQLTFIPEDKSIKVCSITIKRKNIIKSPILYKYFRENVKKTSYKIDYKCEDEGTVKKIFESNSNTFEFFVNLDNYEFLSKLNENLQIRKLGINIENFNNDELFLNQDSEYIIYQKIQKHLLFGKTKSEEKLFKCIKVLNKMKISSNLLSLRNRKEILQKIVALRSSYLAKGQISEFLNNEIEKFKNELDSIPKVGKGNTNYGIIDIIRNDDSDLLRNEVSKSDKFNIANQYDFTYDFSGLLPNKATLFELSIYFNSINCYKFLFLNYINPEKKKFMEKRKDELKTLPRFAFASGNIEMIEFCNQWDLFRSDNHSLYFEIAVAYQNNYLFEYLTQTLKAKISLDVIECAGAFNNLSIIRDLVLVFGANLNPALFGAYKNENIDTLHILIQLKSSDINNGPDISIIFFC